MDDLYGGDTAASAEPEPVASATGGTANDKWTTPVVTEQSGLGKPEGALGDCFTDTGEFDECGPAGSHARS